MQFPFTRTRRLRQSEAIRNFSAESDLSPRNFLVPLFVIEGENIKTEISSMPGYFKFSLDLLLDEIQSCIDLKLESFLLFAQCREELKDNAGTEAYNSDGLMQRAIRAIKSKFPSICLMTDVALDPFSSYGHDGIVENNQIVNDPTVEVLAKMAVSHIEAGADFVAPSDMMDGRILAIREALEEAGFPNAGIMAYSAKYASNFYGPFRDALDSAPGFGDKKTYQMDYRNISEGVKEAVQDEYEGADMVMVKPGMPYLDVLHAVKDAVTVPVSVYQVSGEYSMICAAAEKGWLNKDQAILETLYGFRRAGADLIATYFAKEAVKLL